MWADNARYYVNVYFISYSLCGMYTVYVHGIII